METITVMTYEDWNREIKRRIKRKIVRKWNKGIENVRYVLHRYPKQVVYGMLGFAFFLALQNYATEMDIDAEADTFERTGWITDNGTITMENGDVITFEGIKHNAEWGDKVIVEFNGNHTAEVEDDEIINIAKAMF